MSGEIHPEVMPPGTPHRISPDASHQEPPMHIPRPSSDRAQDVSHILASIFKDLYVKDVMSKDTVHNLTSSSEGSTAFHKKCMKELAKVHSDHQYKLQEYDTVERHIMQARARATSADERALNRATGDIPSEKYEQLGLPPGKSHFRWCLEEQKLKAYKLIVPSDFFSEERHLRKGPKKPAAPRFAIPTVSSSLHFMKEKVYDGYDDLDNGKVGYFSLDSDEKSITTLSSDSADLVSVPPRTPIIRKVKGDKKKDRWRENMNQETRVVDRTLLARLEERYNFLKNPRHIPLSEPKAAKLLTKEQPKTMVLRAGREVVQETTPSKDIQLFTPIPATVRFTQWTVGRVYETVLEIRNVSTVSRKLTILPPKTSFFSLGLGKYPGEDGFIAPGMSAHYSVRFMPDSLADFKDEVEILSQAANPLAVKIEAKRTPPVLTMSNKIDSGYCLVGGVNITEITMKNLGGNGRFCILKKSSWPAANFKTVVNPGCLDMGVFQIRPAVFEVLAGRTATLELIFSPPETETYSEDLVIVCDNCQVKYFSIHGEGQSAAVELVSVSDGGEDEPRVGEIVDLTADHLVRFPPLNPHSFFMRQVIVHNSTDVELPYSWHILTPNLSAPLEALSTDRDSKWKKLDFYPDDSSPFYIEPREGVLQPNGIHEFVATFAPQQIGEYRNVFHLVLSNVPEPKREICSAKSTSKKDNGSLTADSAVKLDRSASRDESAARLSRSNSIFRNSASTRGLSHREVIALEIEVKGHSVPYSVVVHPPAIVIPGSVLEGATIKRPLRMANYSMAPVEYQWSNEMLPNIVQVEPPIGLINPGDIADLEVTVTGSKPGPLSCLLECKIEHQKDPLTLSVVANVAGPNVVIDNVSVSFGLIKLGTSATEKLYVRNTTQLNASWKLSKSGDMSDLYIYPTSGELPPLGQQEVAVTFKPSSPCSLNFVLNLDVEGGESSSIAVRAEAQGQQACFAECTLVLKETFLSVPKRTTATLINQTLFPTSFRFGKLVGSQSTFCNVDVYPKSGLLAPREEQEIEITFEANSLCEVNAVYLPCEIEGTHLPIVLSFFAIIKSLAVDFATPCTEGRDLKIEFNEELKVGSTAKSKLVVTNLTPIRALVTTNILNFPESVAAARQPALDFISYRTRRAMLGRTPNLADPLSKTAEQAFADHAKLMLQAKNGAAFVVEPARSMLEAYQSREITVTAYCDMWGEYKDVLTCEVEGLEPQKIPVKASVVGCPLTFQAARSTDKDTVVRFGTHLEGGPSVSRKMRINNSSSFDIRLDWRTFNYPETDDRKVIDLSVWFGEAFPLKASTAGSKARKSTVLADDNNSISSTEPSPSRKSTTTPGFDQNLPKIVSARIEPHLGQMSNSPFHIEPSQVIVPAHGNVTVLAIFQPLVKEQTDNISKRECLAYSLGYMSLDSKEMRSQDGKVERTDSFDKQPLRLELTAFVQAGMLRIEAEDDEEETSFQMPLSNVLGDVESFDDPRSTEPSDWQKYAESYQTQPLTLTNCTATTLSFSLATNEPFFLESSNGIAYHLPRNLLKPQSNMKIHVGFRVDSMAVAERQEALMYEKKDDTLVCKGDLVIRYSNGVTQHHPLSGVITCPFFQVSETFIDFDTCFVGQEQSRLMSILNQSGSDSYWKVTKEVVSGNGLFRMEPDSGCLEAFVTHKARNKDQLTVYFTATEECASEAILTFKGRLGEPDRMLKVKGSGSFDGRFELK